MVDSPLVIPKSRGSLRSLASRKADGKGIDLHLGSCGVRTAVRATGEHATEIGDVRNLDQNLEILIFVCMAVGGKARTTPYDVFSV